MYRHLHQILIRGDNVVMVCQLTPTFNTNTSISQPTKEYLSTSIDKTLNDDTKMNPITLLPSLGNDYEDGEIESEEEVQGQLQREIDGEV